MNFPILTIDEYVTGEKFENFCDVSCENNQKLNENFLQDILKCKEPVISIFCQTHNLKTVVPVLKTIKAKKFIIVSHNSDGQINYNKSDRDFDYQFEQVDNIVHWFSQNVNVDEANVSCIPIAVENEYIFKPEVKQKLMFKLSVNQTEKDDKIFLCFNPDTNKKERHSAIEYFSDKHWAVIKSGQNNINMVNSYFDEMARHKFVLSPDGNGIDVIRTWEALYIGCVPVVKRHVFTEELSKQVPMIIVDDWRAVTHEYLLYRYHILSEKFFNFNCMRMSYWKDTINKKKAEYSL